MVMSLRKRAAQCACDHINGYPLSRLHNLPPFILNQLHTLMSRRSMPAGSHQAELAAQLINWSTLNIDWSNFDTVSDDSLARLVACKSLQSLNLNAMKGTREEPSAEALLALLPSLGRLTEVQLRRCSQVTDAVVDALTSAAGRSLRTLNLHGCARLTDTSLRLLAERCRALSSINLSACPQLTDAGVAALAESPLGRQLTELQINECVLLTDVSIQRLVDSCPRLRVLTFTGCPLLTGESRAALERLRGGVKQVFWTIY